MKQLSITFLLTVLMSMVGTKAFAQEIAVKNSDGVTIYYIFINNAMELAVSFDDTGYIRYSGDLVIPESVTYNNQSYSVTSIGGGAFDGCSSLTSITIPNSVMSIGTSAFRNCSSLTSINIPHSVTSIGGYAFQGCSSLASITIPNNVTNIGWHTFQGCSSLASITIPNSVTSIGDYAFEGCNSLASVTIPNSVVSIGVKAFENSLWHNSLLNGNGLVYVGKVAYKYNGSMPANTSVTIEDGTLGIAGGAFSGYSEMISISIPNSVRSIGGYAFLGCSGLRKVIVSDLAAWFNIDFHLSYSNPLYYAHHLYTNENTEIIDFVIPDGFTTIGNYVFSGCSSLASITIPNSVTSIGWYAFSGCSSLVSITIPNSVTSIGSYAFYGCSSLASITIPNSVSSIDSYAFQDCSSLSSTTIPNSMTSIDYGVFESCTSLASITIPNNVTSINNYAFYECDSLTRVTVGMTQPITINNTVFSNQSKATLYVPYGSKPAYEVAEVWQDFGEIIEMDTDIDELNNVLYINKADVRIGGQKTLSVKMKNAVEAEGFDFKLYLPEGLSFALDGNGMPEAVLSTERTTASNTDMFSCAIQSDGALRVIGASTGGHVISGSDGEVVRVKINIADSVKEDAYPVILKDIVISDVNASCYEVDSVKSTLDAFSYVLGDANRDTKVNVGDFTSAAHHILDRTPETFNVRAADANDDGKINVADLTAIAHLILYGTIERPSLSSRVMKKVATDISGLDNAIYIDPISLSAGAQHTLSVKMKNAVEAEGFGFDLTLPEGMTFATDGDNNPLVTLSTERTNSAKTNSFSYTILANGSLRVFGASTVGQSISGSDGEIVRIVINIDGSVAEGDYPLLLSNISISDVNALSYDIDQVEATVTVTPFVDDRIVLDENSTTSIENATNVNVRVLRTINANEWSTICLPFSMTEAQVYDAFGDDVELADFVSYTSEKDAGNNIVGISVGFSDVTAMEANHPYIVKVSNRIDEFSVEGVDIVVEDEPCTDFDNGKSGKNYVWYGSFTGTYHAQTTVPNLCLFLSGNKFWYSTGQTKMKAFRGYFDFEDKLTAVEQANARIAINVKDRTAGLKEAVSSKKETVCFDLQGRRIKSPTKKGLYVVNGKKMVIR